MIGYTVTAERHLDEFRLHYLELERLDALRNLDAALDQAEIRISANPKAGLAAPRPYPELARTGTAWIHIKRYWISYRLTVPAVITGIFYDAANIPRRR